MSRVHTLSLSLSRQSKLAFRINSVAPDTEAFGKARLAAEAEADSFSDFEDDEVDAVDEQVRFRRFVVSDMILFPAQTANDGSCISKLGYV